MAEIARIHSANFTDEFVLPDFMDYVCAFVVEDSRGIITAGGIRDIAEGVIVTDKSRSPQERMKAIYKVMDASVFVSKKSGYDQIYVFSQDPKWTKRLKKMGFRTPQGEALVLDL
jgi:hypothetical protein